MNRMQIFDANPRGKTFWNQFLKDHYPPIGAFMQTWEWGEFQKSLGRESYRYLVADNGRPVALFTLVRHSLPFGLSYGYAPRGPVTASGLSEESKLDVFKAIGAWTKQNFPSLIFTRLEPPISSLKRDIRECGFHVPPYYVQPRYNTAVVIDRTESEILASFHPSTRSNIRRAEKRGVIVESKPRMAEADYDQFFAMTRDTMERGGRNVYPSPSYFRSLISSIPSFAEVDDRQSLSLGIFYGYHQRQPAAANFVLFFGDTATYLFGASYRNHLHSKVATYLHWVAMQEARKRGFRYYDLGGIDEARWPTLTDFKRQFRGREFQYIGDIDIPLRPFLYRIFNLVRGLKKTG